MNALVGPRLQGVYGLKPRFQNLLRPLARTLAARGIRANQVTLLACALSAAFGLALASLADTRSFFLLLPPFLLLRMALNALDGMLAREFDQKSHLGAYLNELGDVVSDAFCYLPFAFLPEFDPLWIGAVIVLALASEMAGVIGPMTGASRRYDGPMGKSDRAVVFGALALWIGAGAPLARAAAMFVEGALVVLLAATVVNRVSRGLAEVARDEVEESERFPPRKVRRESREHHFETHDGTRLFYRYWPGEGSARQTLVFLHRGHEHSGRMAHLVDELDLPGFAVFAWDARGHGRSCSAQNGKEPTLGTFVKDLDCFVRHISRTHYIPEENIAIVSQSVGSVLAATWAHDYGPRIRCMVLAAPAFKVKLYVPFARPALTLLHRLVGDFHVKSYVRAAALTHDPERIASYQADPYITRPISVRVLLGLYGTSDRIVSDAQAIQVPTQVLISSSDWVVHQKPQLEFFERLGAQEKEKHAFAGFYHDILGEKDRHLAIERVRQFVLRMFAAPPRYASLRDADQASETRKEFDALRRPLSWLSPKRLGFAITKLGLWTGGRLSDGIRLGLKTGFDSGSSLDYVYRNRASGVTLLGKTIDRCYLDSTGWRGIRVRKRNLVQALCRCMAALRAEGKAVRILDVAAGHGRYVLEAMEQDGGKVDDVLLQDAAGLNVLLGSQLVKERNLDRVVRFEKRDAFDPSSVGEVSPWRTLGVVSGLYELFPDNGPVRRSLAGLAHAIELGGFLVYTGQPFHPQLEMIARTLPNREQRPWIMRRRTQAEIDELVAAAGFQKVEQWIDDEGIFSVSIAQRIVA